MDRIGAWQMRGRQAPIIQRLKKTSNPERLPEEHQSPAAKKYQRAQTGIRKETVGHPAPGASHSVAG